MRIFLDANVLFSASHSGSAIGRLIVAAMQKATVVTSDLACAEARRNLSLKRPAWSSIFEALVQQIEVTPSTVFPLPVTLADKDIPILCAAVRAECRYLVTGDRRDFDKLFDHTVHDVTAITPVRLAELMARANEE